MSKIEDTMRDAGKVQADPALAAIEDLGDSVKTSFKILEEEDKKVEGKVEKLFTDVKADLEKTRTEMAAGFKVQGDKLNTLDRRSVALGYQGTRDVDGCCLAALGEEEKSDISGVAWMQSRGPKDRERFPLLSSSIGSTLVAHWLRASLLLQKRRFASQAQEQDLYLKLAKYEKALGEAFMYEKAAAFLTTTTDLGGHWIPDPVAAELYRLITDNSVIGSQCSHIPMSAKTIDLPTEGSSSLSVDWGSENTNITDSVPASNALNKVVLTASRLNGWAASSIEELQDSAVSILAWVQQKLTELMGREIDRVFLEGLVGSAPLFAGLGTASGVNAMVNGTVNGDALTYLMLTQQVFKARERASREGARWYVAPEIMAKIVGMVDSQGMPVVQFGNVPNAFAASILGFPVEVHSVILANRTYGTGTTLSHMYFGPPKAMVLGDRMGMAWDTSDQANFRGAQVQMRLITRLGFGIAVPAAFSRHENVQAT